jgi:nucleoside-diphosphate-sugar epimerase
MTTKQRILIVGHGRLGRPLAMNLSNDYNVTCLTRSIPDDTLPASYQFIKGDLQQPESLTFLENQRYDQVVVVISPSAYNDESYFKTYVQGMQHLLRPLKANAFKPKRVLFVSSTSVYHQNQGEWVNENTHVEPHHFSGKRLLEAEHLLNRSGILSSCIRFSGIYGGDRSRLLQQALLRPEISTTPEKNEPYTNRIHEADCLGILKHLIERQANRVSLQPVYLASDCLPATRKEVCLFIQQASLQKVRQQWPSIHFDPSKERSSEDHLKRVRRAGSKRCANERLMNSGYHFQFPDFKIGYQDMINALPHEQLYNWMLANEDISING